MIMAGEEYMGDFPFENVYFTGIVRDKLGRKMSKSLGNSPDPIGLIDNYGADGVRLGMMLCTSAGNDILFDESQVEQGRNFCNKIWNAYRLVKGWQVADKEQDKAAKVAVDWFSSHLSKTIEAYEDHFSKFRITEELWQNIAERREGETIMLQDMPVAGDSDDKLISDFEAACKVVMELRALRQGKGISPKEALNLKVKGDFSETMYPVVEKMANIGSIAKSAGFENEGSGQSFLVGTLEFFVPLEGMIDKEGEIAKIQAEITRYEGFLKGVNAKLSNEKFVANAPAQVVETERKKLSDATAKIEALKARLKELS